MHRFLALSRKRLTAPVAPGAGATDLATTDGLIYRLKNPVIFPHFLICIFTRAANEKIRIGTKGVVTGWGNTENATHPAFLRQVEVEIPGADQCRGSLDGQPAKLQKLNGKSFCAGRYINTLSICTGGCPVVPHFYQNFIKSVSTSFK